MRKEIYSLYQLDRSDMGRNPLSGEVFLFLGKTRALIQIKELTASIRSLKEAILLNNVHIQ